MMKPVQINTLFDIKKAIRPFVSSMKPADVSFATEVSYKDEHGKDRKEKITCETSGVSLRQMLIDGFTNVKMRTEALDKARKMVKNEEEHMPNFEKLDIDNIRISGIDDLIRDRLGGKRRGLRVRWEIKEGIFEFDPFSGKLFTIEEDDARPDS